MAELAPFAVAMLIWSIPVDEEEEAVLYEDVDDVVSTSPSPSAVTVVTASYALITASPLPDVSDAAAKAPDSTVTANSKSVDDVV